MGTWTRRDPGALVDLADAVDELHAASGTPVTARRLWMQCWLDADRTFEPWLVGVESAEGRLDGLAVLATRRRFGVRQVVVAGHGPSDVVTMASRDVEAGRRLVAAVAHELRRITGPWWVRITGLPPGSPAALLAEHLPHAVVVPGHLSPTLLVAPGASLRDHVSAAHRRGIARIRNRMTRTGLAPAVEHVRDAAHVARLLPEVEHVFRRRDQQVGRACALDSPEGRDFFRSVVRRHAEAGAVCLTTVRLQGQLAAYVLCFVDGNAFRMWNCRFDPAWGRFSPGKLAIDDSVAHALEQGAQEYDFMRGDEAYKRSYATHHPRGTDLFVGSGPVAGAVIRGVVALRTWMRDVAERGGRGGEVVEWTRTVRARLR